PAILGRGWRPLQIWALIRLGRLDEAEATLADFATVASEQRIPSRGLRVGHLSGLLADARGDTSTADRCFSAARLASTDLALPFYRALVDLDWGRSLRRRGKHRVAIDALCSARERLAELRALPFVAACDAELSALGRKAPTGHAQLPVVRLTHQEQAVARLVSEGLSNREAAAQLYVSPKTIEFHLGNVYAKLGIRSRSQLVVALAGGLG
ncbi:MAG: helix-turn-helix transcriptional regulator, partial [Acidimicrobiales bacterium]